MTRTPVEDPLGRIVDTVVAVELVISVLALATPGRRVVIAPFLAQSAIWVVFCCIIGSLWWARRITLRRCDRPLIGADVALLVVLLAATQPYRRILDLIHHARGSRNVPFLESLTGLSVLTGLGLAALAVRQWVTGDGRHVWASAARRALHRSSASTLAIAAFVALLTGFLLPLTRGLALAAWIGLPLVVARERSRLVAAHPELQRELED